MVSTIFTDTSLAGIYTIYAGPIDNYQYYTNIDPQPGNYADNAMNYYFRSDADVNSRISLCCDELPPYFHLADAQAELVGDEYLYIIISGAALDQSLSVAELESQMNEVYPFIQFQSASNNYYQPEDIYGFGYNYPVDGFIYYFTVESRAGVKYISLHMCVRFMLGTSTVYNTHLNLQNSYRQANCVMENDFEHSYEFYSGTFGTVNIEVFSHPAGSNTVDNSYGNLGIRLNNYHA